MKHQHLLLLAGLGLTALTACTDPDAHSTWDRGGTDVSLTATIQQPEGATTAPVWTDGERVGLFMLPAGGSLSQALERNLQLSSDADGSLHPTTADDAVSVPLGQGSVDFVAYAPYRNAGSGGVLPVDVTDQSDGTAIDLLYARLDGHAEENTAATLTFRHCLTKLVVNITADATLGSTEGLSVVLTGAPSTGSFALETGTLTVDATSVADIAMTPDATGATAAAIVLPATTTGGMQLRFELNGQSFTTQLDANELPAGSVVTTTANLSQTDGTLTVSLGGATIADWTEQPGGHIDADFDQGGDDNPGPDEPGDEADVIFEETMGTDPIEKEGNYWPYLSNFTGWSSGLTFTDVNSTLSARRTNNQNHIWFPAGKENDLQIEGFSTEGYTKLTLTYKLAANLYSAGETQEASAMKGSLNGVAFETPARVLANPDDNNQFYTVTVELPAEAASATSVLHFTTTAADNQMGLRLAEIKLTGTK